MLKKLKYLNRYLRLKKHTYKNINNNKMLSTGVYQVSKNLNYAYNIDADLSNFRFIIENDKSDFIKQILTRKKIKIDNKYSNYDLIIFSNDSNVDKGYKVFNFSDKIIMTKFIEDNKFNKYLLTYDYFKNYFLLPEINSIDKKNKTIKESLVDFIPNKHYSDFEFNLVINCIFKDYTNYYRKASSYNSIVIAEMLDEMKLDNEMYNFVNLIEENISLSLPCLPRYRQHGDLWSPNILLKKDETIVIIDWEHANKYSICYDIFFLMQNEFIYGENKSFLKMYLNGKYDNYFYEILSIENVKFDKNRRFDYLLHFLVEFSYYRIYLSSNKSDGVEIYYSFLKELLREIEL